MPVDAEFAGNIVLTCAISTEIMTLELAETRPAVITMEWLPVRPIVDIEMIDESESQNVDGEPDAVLSLECGDREKVVKEVPKMK